MDVKSIIQQWYKELATDAVEFEAQAKRVAIWDFQLRENQKTLEETVDNVHRIMASQSDLKAACESVETYQNEMEVDLNKLSADLDQEIEALQLQEPTEDDYEREKTFLLAEDLNQTLNQMESNLKKVCDDLNKSRGIDNTGLSGAGSSTGSITTGDVRSTDENPIAKIVAVLNNHHESLAWLDDKAKQMEKDMAIVRREMNIRTST